MRLVIKNSIQLCLRTLVFSIVLRHSNYNNRIIAIEIRGYFFGGHPVVSISKSRIFADGFTTMVTVQMGQ
jgi:hypothetical protein